MTESSRAAVYAAPGFGDDAVAARLCERAQAWLGRAVDGAPVARECPPGWTREQVDEITVAARSYGFHGTLKAPFRLDAGRTLTGLCDAVDELAAASPPVVIPRLTLAPLGGFLALVPGGEAPDLRALADAAVTGLDRFRAPLTAPERERRRPETLTERQRDLLDRWGYPYVLDEFRFHLTLTDSIPSGRRPGVQQALQSWFGEYLGADLVLDAVAVFTQESPTAPFVVHSVHRLAGPDRTHSTARPASPALEGTDR
ncbi:DUF1045 domain-containing protein [Gordonia sp. HY002]|uniref:DUF1045 domain-containing protein n=1 Tax=Gordonia zhenghanii TaxID=2911516 RepID=UPI001F368821|nr:DUF1045 domain-containing protein [Gordonia zhenghanii]MCF8572206.1 DUF1045 domain-containing protein [Gordonia zhenghanii]